VTGGVSGGGSLTAAVSRRPPISLYTVVPRTGGYAYAVGVWDFSLVLGPTDEFVSFVNDRGTRT
jgi:hypothetical protein